MKFTEQEIEFIKNNYTNFGNKYCSEKLNRSKSSIEKVASRLKLKVNRSLMIKNNPELLQKLKAHSKKVLQPINEKNKIKLDKQEVVSLYESGKSLEEIAVIYKCSEGPISKILKNINKRSPGQSLKHKCHNQFGDKNPAWKGGIKSIYDTIRGLTSYRTWRTAILNRDNNKCAKCNSSDKLHSHHIITLKTLIYNYSLEFNKATKDFTYEDLNSDYFYDISNGITLCESCHKAHHKEHGR